MEFYEGIFDPQFKISRLKQKYYLIPLEEFSQIRKRVEKSVKQVSRLEKNKKILQLINNDRKIKDLQETYQLHESKHPYCPVLPKIRQEISKRRKLELSGSSHVRAKILRESTSLTPDPRLKFCDTLMVNSLKSKPGKKIINAL